MLARCNLAAREPFCLAHRRQPPAFALRHLRCPKLGIGGVVAVLLVEREKPVEQNDGAVRAQAEPAGGIGDVDGDLLEQRRGHLARHSPLPDQLVEPELVAVEMAGNVGGPARQIGGPDRLVRLLRVLSGAAVNPRRVRQVA